MSVISGGWFDILTATVAGVVSFLSPCVLPLVPGYISWVSGSSLESLTSDETGWSRTRQTFIRSVLFVFGFSLVFILLGATATTVGVFLEDHRVWIMKVAGIVVILFGFHLIGLIPIKFLYKEKRFQVAKSSASAMSAVVVGAAFAFGWTPCIGPILAGILALAATQDSVYRGMMLLAFYSAGLGIPFILSALAMDKFLKFFKKYKKYIRWGEIVGGLLLIMVGVLIFSDRLTFLIRFVPDFLFKFSL